MFDFLKKDKSNTQQFIQPVVESASSSIRKKGNKTIFITKDGGFIEMDRTQEIFILVIPKNKNKKPFIKKVSVNFLVAINEDNEEIEENTSIKNLEVAVSNTLQEFKYKNGDKYDISFNVSRFKYQYEILFNKENGSQKKITVWCGASKNGQGEQIKEFSQLLLSYYGYESIEEITMINFYKDFWESLFIQKSGKVKMSPQDVYLFTTKLGKMFEVTPNSDPKIMLDALIRQSSPGSIRNTAIKLLHIMRTSNVELPVAMKKDPDNFDPVYISIIETGFKAGSTKIVEAFKQLAEITQRTYYLRRAIKKALKTPIFAMIVMIAVMIGAVKLTVPIIEDVYASFKTEVPALTMALKSIVYALVNNWYISLVIGMVTLSSYSFWSQYTMYGKKFMHDLSITLPILGNFFKGRDFEIFSSIGSMLYPIGSDNKIILDQLKTVVGNYHLRGVINTAALKWQQSKIRPGDVFSKFPMYIDPKIANAFKAEGNPAAELAILAKLYKNENNDFIENLEKVLEPVLMIMVVGTLGFIIASVVLPLYNIVTIVK